MIVVLRLGHRLSRDARTSTHCGLVSRAFGAEKIIYSGEEDHQLLESVNSASGQWGGSFAAVYEKNWKSCINLYKKKRFLTIHLTMYGEPFQKKIAKIRKSRNILLIAGAEKVPAEVYQLADYNIAIANQPHSEVAALAIFLHEYFRGKELEKKFPKAKIRIIPQKRGKLVARK